MTLRIGYSGRVAEFNVGGNSRYVAEIARHIDRNRIDYIPITPRRQLPIGPPGLRYSLAETQWAAHIPKRTDLLHFPADTGPLITLPIHGPLVSTIHGVASRHLANVRTQRKERSWRRRVGALAAMSRGVITVSASSATDIAETFGVDYSKIEVIEHGIDHKRFNPTRSAIDNHELQALDLPEKYLLYLGNLDPRKNLVSLCRAIEGLNTTRSTPPLIIAGRPAWGSEPILDEIRKSPHVRYIGGVPESALAPLMRNAQAFLFPSLYEGFGFPVLEAMACGTPVVTTHRGSLKDVASNHAIIVDPDSIESISLGVERILQSSNLRVETAEAALGHVKRFSWQRSAELHADFFERYA